MNTFGGEEVHGGNVIFDDEEDLVVDWVSGESLAAGLEARVRGIVVVGCDCVELVIPMGYKKLLIAIAAQIQDLKRSVLNCGLRM